MSAPMNIQHRRTPSTTAYYAPQPTHARSLSSQLGTSWSDGFEFTSCSPLTSALHLGTSPPMNNAYLPSACASMSMSCSPRGDYFSFERDYCSNFACCGITLPDMHALVAHFEETHFSGAEGSVPSMAHHHGLAQRTAVSVPQAKPTPQININTNTFTNNNIGAGTNPAPGTARSSTGDASSPHSSVGPETPPSASRVGAGHRFPQGLPQLQVQTQIYGGGSGGGSRVNSASPYASSPLSAGSPASSGSYESHTDSSGSGSGSGSSSQTSSTSQDLDMDVDMDVLMSFDPLDGVHTPLDSTPPSPLAPPMRPSSVLRAAALKNNGGQPDVPPVGFPPSLFSVPLPLAPSVGPSPLGLGITTGEREKDSRRERERRERREREREKRSRASSPNVLADVTDGTLASSSTGGAVRREKKHKAASTMSSLLGLDSGSGSSSRSSFSSFSDEGSANGDHENSAKGEKREREEKVEKVVEKPQRPERAERTGRPERVDKSGKRTREKAYKCPKPGCTKSYLNPNGLKYHAAKGTCTFANGSSAPPTPVTPTTPSIPSIPSILSIPYLSSNSSAAASVPAISIL